MDEDIEEIWKEFEAEDNALHKMAQHQQLMYEQTIGNIAALKALNDNSIEQAVKNS
jgi:hypothetical protein